MEMNGGGLGARRYSAGAGYYNSTIGLPNANSNPHLAPIPNHLLPASGRASQQQNAANMPVMYRKGSAMASMGQMNQQEALNQYMV